MEFKAFPFLSLPYVLEPPEAALDFAKILMALVNDQNSAATVFQRLLDHGKKAGVQVFIRVEHPESALPEAHRLTRAILSLDRKENVYHTPAAKHYNSLKLYQIFGVIRICPTVM